MEQTATVRVGDNTRTAPKRDRAVYMREYRKRVGRDASRENIPTDLRGDCSDVTCPLCFESFESGAAYLKHFRETRWGPGEVHQCLTRETMRQSGTLAVNWETGSWRVQLRS